MIHQHFYYLFICLFPLSGSILGYCTVSKEEKNLTLWSCSVAQKQLDEIRKEEKKSYTSKL